MKFSEIIEPIKSHLTLFDQEFMSSLRSDVCLLDQVLNHVAASKGKQIRPAMMILSAELVGGATARTYRGAAMIETMHLATLLHDDVIDQAQYRRNRTSVNAEWNNKISILVGDYLLAEALNKSLANQDHDLIGLMSMPIMRMSEGELLQMEYEKNLDLTEDVYYQIIHKKTAVLFAASCACGALSAENASQDKVDLLHKIGETLGYAFQIKDDLLDIAPDAHTGKAKGNDIREHKLTLPLIHFLKQANPKDKKIAEEILLKDNPYAEEVDYLSRLVFNSDSVSYTEEKIKYYTDQTLQLLDEFEDSSAKTVFRNLIEFVSYRKH